MDSVKSETFVTAPAGVLVPKMHPWEQVAWPSQQRRSIYRSWAQSFAAARHNTSALKYFNKCIEEHETEDFLALCMRSKFNRTVAQADAALEDSKRAAKIASPWNAPVNLQIADALYDLNKFEENKIQLHNNSRVHVGTTKLPFEHRLTIVNSNFKDSVGDSLGPFMLKNSGKFRLVHEQMLKSQEIINPLTRWKILRALKECDVQSVADKKEVRISPLEAARRKRKTKIYYQNYMNETWTDIAFLKTLRHNPIVLLESCYGSKNERGKHLSVSYERVKKFTQMLHNRSPIYNESYRPRANPQLSELFHEANMFRIQYQTRRNMISILRTVRALRQQKDVVRLQKFVSKVMGQYNVLKTQRVMPWKTEFMNEVYNHLALSLCESYRLPSFKVSPYDNDSMCHLLGVSPLKPSEQHEVVFGKRSTYSYEDSGSVFEQGKAYKRARIALEKRLYFAKLPIERSYLLYELADCHLSQNHLVHCLLNAKRSIDEARRCNSKIWEFLATMLQAKSHAILCKYERQAEVLNDAYHLAKDLKSPRLCTFIELCRMVNRDYMTLRKMSQLVATKRLRSKLSNRSSCISPQLPDFDATSTVS